MNLDHLRVTPQRPLPTAAQHNALAVSSDSSHFMRELYQAAKKCGRSMGYDDDNNSDAASGVRMAFIRGAQWAKMKEADEILSFFERVNAAATAKVYWSEDFRRAFYDAAHEEATRHAMRKSFNAGERTDQQQAGGQTP